MAWDSDTMASPSCIRHAAVRIHHEEIRQVEPAEFAAGVDMLMSKIELADQPHDFLDIERTAPSPDFQHAILTPAFDGSRHSCIFLSESSATGQTLRKISV
jgi:hypothetical protein